MWDSIETLYYQGDPMEGTDVMAHDLKSLSILIIELDISPFEWQSAMVEEKLGSQAVVVCGGWMWMMPFLDYMLPKVQ